MSFDSFDILSGDIVLLPSTPNPLAFDGEREQDTMPILTDMI